MSYSNGKHRSRVSNMPVLIAMAVLILMVVLVYYLQRTNLPTPGESVAGNLECGAMLSGNVTLTGPLACAEKQTALMSEADPEKVAALGIGGEDVVLDCAGNAIEGKEGVGLYLRNAKRVTVRNCRFSGFKVDLYADNVQALRIEQGAFSGTERGVEVRGGSEIEVAGSVFEAPEAGAKWGVEIFDAKNVTVSSSRFAGYRLGAINFYGARSFKAANNIIEKIGDTAIGLFAEKDGAPSGDGVLTGNSIHEITTVSAFEIMHGAENISITKNRIGRAPNALHIYDAKKQPNRYIHFTENHIDQVKRPFQLTWCSNLAIGNNEVERATGGVLANIEHCENLLITGNQFRMTYGAIEIGDAVDSINITDNDFTESTPPVIRVNHEVKNLKLEPNEWGKCALYEHEQCIEYAQGVPRAE